MSDLNLKTFDKLYPMIIHKYDELFDDQNANIMDRINTIVNYLNQVGKLTNDVVKDWNVVYQWVMNDGLTTDVNNKIEAMKANGELNQILQNIFNSLTGDMTTLHTTAKDTLVNSINEVDDLAKANQTHIGDLTTLTTADKDTIVHAINDNTTQLAQKVQLINVKNYGAKGDGVTDDTAACLAAFNYAATIESVEKIIVFPTATYMISGIGDGYYGQLRIPSNTIVDLCGSTLKMIPNTSSHASILRAETKNNIVIKNGFLYGDFVQGDGKPGEWNFGTMCNSCYNVTIDNIKCYNFRGDGIYFGYNDVTIKNENVLLNNCYVSNVYRNGISFTAGKNIIVQNSMVENTTGLSLGAGIDFEPDQDVDAYFIESALVQNCKFNSIQGSAIRFQYSKYCKARFNKVTNAITGFEARESYGMTIEQNLFDTIQSLLFGNLRNNDDTLFIRNKINNLHDYIGGTGSSYIPFTFSGTGTGKGYFEHNLITNVNTGVVIRSDGGDITISNNEIINTQSECIVTYSNTNAKIFNNVFKDFANLNVMRIRGNSTALIRGTKCYPSQFLIANNETGAFNTDIQMIQPNVGTYYTGDFVRNTYLNSDYTTFGWLCNKTGTMGTLNGGATTGSITSGTNSLTVSANTGLQVGQYITIAGVTGTFKVTTINGTTVTIDSNAGATVSNAAVAYSAATFLTKTL